MNRLKLNFTFTDTETAAIKFCDNFNKNTSYYIRKNKPAHYTPWSSPDRNEHKFICWYYS